MWPSDVIDACRKTYMENEDIFRPAGFTREICERVGSLMFSLGPWDAFQLFREASKIPDGGTYCEIGGAWGGSLLCAYEAVKAAGRKARFICIDLHLMDDLKTILEKTGAEFCCGISWEVAESIPGPFDFLLIDGSHRYHHVLRDIQLYVPKVRPGGTVLMHDFTWHTDEEEGENLVGVVRAIHEAFPDRDITRLRNSIYARIIMD